MSTANEIFAIAVRHHMAGEWADAISGYQSVIAILPDCAEAYCNLGIALTVTGRLDEAIAASRRAIEIKPDFFQAHNNLGNALLAKGLLREAVESFQKAISLSPTNAEAHINLANVSLHRGQFDASIESARRAIALRPDLPQAQNSLGVALKDTCRARDAIAAFSKAVQIDPGYVDAHSNLLMAMMYPGLPEEAIFAEHRAWAQRHAKPLEQEIEPWRNDLSGTRRLRVGYVSADFRRHPVGYFILPLLKNHDRTKFEIFGYANVASPDVVTERIKGCCDGWRSIVGVADASAARQIRADEIDILVDLAGHTSNHRLLIFARKPAPVQVTYLGYPNSTGLGTIDYRLTDSLADPPGMTEAHNVEKLWRLSGCAWCFEPQEAAPPISAKESGLVTFGCFNAFAKITAPLVDMWAELLKRTAGSKLLLKSLAAGNPSSQGALRERFRQLGISGDRIEMIGQVPDARLHFGLYNRVDVALDTYPYHGTTTTCEALWMGVPVVSLAGKTHVSRVGSSLLNHVGFPELIASDAEAYVCIAADWAGDEKRRAEFRRSIRQRMSESRLMNAKAFAADIEDAYRKMWDAWCAAGTETNFSQLPT